MLNLCRQYVYSERCDTLNLWKLPGNLGQSFYFLIFNLRSKMIIIFLFSFESLFRFHLIILCLSYLSKAKILFQNKDGDLPRGATRGRCRGTNFSQRVWKCRNPPHIRGDTCKSCILQYTKFHILSSILVRVNLKSILHHYSYVFHTFQTQSDFCLFV